MPSAGSIRDAFRRVGIPHGRAHALRHTVACRLVDQGGSIKEVADVLRHRSLNTSLIYAKLDNRSAGRRRAAVARERGMSAPDQPAGQGRAVPGRAPPPGLRAQHHGAWTGAASRATWPQCGHHGPLTVDLMADWARQAKGGRGDRATSARRLKMLRPFTRWLRQFEPPPRCPTKPSSAGARPDDAAHLPRARDRRVCWPPPDSSAPTAGCARR